MKTTTIPTALLTMALILAATACGGPSPDHSAETALAAPTATTAVPPSTTITTPERPTQLVDEIVGIDSGRMHIHCNGSGAATVLLLAGWDAGGDESWGAIQPSTASRARVCSYDRFGTGTSDAPAATQTFTTQAADLHALLEAAGEPGPYIVVGHSFGGAEAVSFASHYRDEVVGLMLIDASPTTWPAALCAVPDDGTQAAQDAQTTCALFHDPARDAERLDVFAAFDEVATVTSLDDLPMTVMTAGQRTLPGLAASEISRLNGVWNEGVAGWAALSSSSTVVTVENTGHYIQLEHPDLVIEALTTLLP